MKRIRLLLAVVLASVCSIGMRAQTDVTSQYLQNADLQSLEGWSYGDNGHNYTDWRPDAAVPVIEHWNSTKTFHLTQEVTLPAGAYRFEVHAFYREGGKGNGTNNNGYMVIGDNKKYVHALTSEETTFNLNFAGGSAFLRAATAFSQGYYNNTFDFSLENEQTLTLGVRGTITTSDSWFVHGPFKLYTFTLADYLNEYRTEVSKAEALYDKPMNATTLSELKAAVVSESTLTTSALAVQATATLKAAIAAANASISAYARLMGAINEANAYIVKCQLNGAPETNAMVAYETAYNNGTVPDSEVDAKIAEIHDIMKTIGLSQNSWQRIAPTMPRTLSLESGKIYYLYNVGADRFLKYDKNYSAVYALTNEGMPVKISAINDTEFNIMLVSDNQYMGASESSIWSQTSSTNSDYFRFKIAEVDGGYTIQRVYQSNEYEYVGFDGSDGDRIKPNLTNGNYVWQLFDVEEAARFIAKRNLYRALVSAEGYEIDQWEFVYDNDASSNYVLQEAADILNDAVDASNKIIVQDWSDYKILFYTDNLYDNWSVYSTELYGKSITTGSRILQATINIDDDATLVYEYNRGGTWSGMEVYLDGEFYQFISSEEGESQQRYFIEMGVGKHIIKWKFVNYNTGSSSYCYIRNVGVEQTPTMVVSLLEPGSLGTEVLKQTDHIQNVRKLVINGEMNSDDWDRILMMTNLFSLDLTNVPITEIPASSLVGSQLPFLHQVKLPTTLNTIGNSAFFETLLDEITFPGTLTSIGEYAFGRTRIKEAIIPETVTYIGEGAFEQNQSLEYVSYPVAAKSIPDYCFHKCKVLQPFDIPEGITSIGYQAFYECLRYDTNIPSSVKTIGTYAFNNCALNKVVLPENVSVSNEAFEYSKLKTITFPTSMYIAPYRGLKYNNSLTDIYLKSPTMVNPNEFLQGCNASNITVHVPDYLVNTYKQDSYWYNYNIVGFNTADIKDWYINQPLTLGADARIAGQPNIHMERSGSIKISGDAPMTIDDLWTCKDWNAGAGWNTMLLSTCDNVSVSGKYTHRVYTPSKRWVFICLPFDTKVDDITSESSFAIRYYDGANRAENGSGGNWKNYSKDDIIPAGTGFILQTSRECSTWFTAQDNASKQYVFQNKEFVKALEANVSESNANKGWNLVGNPWLSYYNIHKLNFTAPITVWNVDNRNYTAYSIIDDDYAIKPNEAFFVQCPDEVNSISFPVDGRQLTSVIESQNAVKSLVPQEKTRWLIDVELSNGELSDKTRFVLNEKASLDYEMTCDASKFFSMDATVPQIYTIEHDEMFAINERPLAEGIVKLGVKVATDGQFSITAPRNDFSSIILIDNETGMETDLTAGGYAFSVKAGSYDNRFELRLTNSGVQTGIATLDEEATETSSSIFTLDGRQIVTPAQKGVYIMNGKKVIIK